MWPWQCRSIWPHGQSLRSAKEKPQMINVYFEYLYVRVRPRVLTFADTKQIGKPPLCHPLSQLCGEGSSWSQKPLRSQGSTQLNSDWFMTSESCLMLSCWMICWTSNVQRSDRSLGVHTIKGSMQNHWFTNWLSDSILRFESLTARALATLALMSVTCASFWQPGDSGETYSATSSMASLGCGGDIRYASDIYMRRYAKIRCEDLLRRCTCSWQSWAVAGVHKLLFIVTYHTARPKTGGKEGTRN